MQDEDDKENMITSDDVSRNLETIQTYSNKRSKNNGMLIVFLFLKLKFVFYIDKLS